MAKEELLQLEGVVIETLPNTTFKVRLEGQDRTILAYLGGKMRQFDIHVSIGDKVKLEVSPYDLSKGRIVFRQ